MWLACPECREESAFEQPPCTEGHGLDCPEWFCVTCGSPTMTSAATHTRANTMPPRLSRMFLPSPWTSEITSAESRLTTST